MKRGVILLLICALLLTLLSFRVIQTSDGTFVLTKPSLSVRDTYIDTRNWDVSDYFDHPEITTYLLKRKSVAACQLIERELPIVWQRTQEAIKKGEQRADLIWENIHRRIAEKVKQH